MNPNIYTFAHTEAAQDAFIAWLCSCYNQQENSTKRVIANKFVRELLGITVPFSSIEVKLQEKKIDILLILHDGNKDYSVIIEDKKFSEYHSEQLERYINSLPNKENTFVVYYKTGHLSRTPNSLSCVDKKFIYNPKAKSEFDWLMDVKEKHKKLLGFKICELKDINSFFQSVSEDIKRSGSEILEDYAANIKRQYERYSSDCIQITSTEEFPKPWKEPIWARTFDEYIARIGTKRFPRIMFKLDFYQGNYWEIYIAEKKTEPIELFDFPLIDITSQIFEGKTKRIFFFQFFGLNNRLPNNKGQDNSSRYIVPFGNFKKYPLLNSLNFMSEMVKIEDLYKLFDAICEEFEKFIEPGSTTIYEL